MTRNKKNWERSGFSLLEVVIVVAIIAILAAIGIPRMSRGSRGAGDSALRANLSVLRNAVDLFSAEHQGNYPTAANVANQLIQYSNTSGSPQESKDDTHIYGPYLRSVPPLPVGARKGGTQIAAADANDVGWIYNQTTGAVTSNTTATEKDDAGIAYSDY